ncbi:MAG: class A beta-lactamase-related serine hydrolase, partial [Verrucomicrobiaceae bacterium]|nr:class A beta-lactamase-related serine hydrolase [Verrucomicrobiaceae bacterium]
TRHMSLVTRHCMLALVLAPACLLADFREFRAVPVDPALGAALTRVADITLKEFPKLTADNLALSVIDLTRPENIMRADYRGDAQIYPASLVKLFFMVETYHQGKLTPEIERALREMIYVSDNDAAAFLVDILTDTASGSELEGKALEDFIDRRRKLNRFFASLGYDISAMMKPWSFGPFGRDMQLLGENKVNRNRASANSFASLLFWIVRRHAISPQASDAMMSLLERPLSPPRPIENQVKEFFGESLPPGSKLWSKSGETSEVRHDAAYIELPTGRKLIIVILTRGAADDKTLLPAIGKHFLAEVSR